jgi:uncharacterized protein (UPF0332 family)
MTEVERERVQHFMSRAERALTVAQYELDGGFGPEAISSSYYAALYAAKALLMTRGIATNRHSAVLRLVGREFVQTGVLDRGHSRIIGLLLESRIAADYDAAPAFTIAEAQEHLEQARDFVATASALLDDILAEE